MTEVLNKNYIFKVMQKTSGAFFLDTLFLGK